MSAPRTTAKNLLLTGPPGCGKTTVVCRVLQRLRGRRLAGFYTQEIRRQGQRLGFEAVGLGGRSAVLAHVHFRSPLRVGRYRVDLAAFEAIVHEELDKPETHVDLFVIDEIGKMECSSRAFVEAVERLLSGPARVLATIAAKGGGLIARAKVRPDVELLVVSAANRDALPGEIVARWPLGGNPGSGRDPIGTKRSEIGRRDDFLAGRGASRLPDGDHDPAPRSAPD